MGWRWPVHQNPGADAPAAVAHRKWLPLVAWFLRTNVLRLSLQGYHMARKRELIQPHEGDERYMRRDGLGRFTTDQVDLHPSVSQDDRTQARRTAPEGQGDGGDRHPKK